MLNKHVLNNTVRLGAHEIKDHAFRICLTFDVHYNTRFAYCSELAPATISLTGDCVRGGDSKQDSYYNNNLSFDTSISVLLICMGAYSLSCLKYIASLNTTKCTVCIRIDCASQLHDNLRVRSKFDSL